MIEALPGMPVLTVGSAASLINRSEQAVNEALPRLLEARVISQPRWVAATERSKHQS